MMSMRMPWIRVVINLFLLAIVESSYLKPDGLCRSNLDCPITFFCNADNFCELVKTTNEVEAKQPCSGTFKSKCLHASECKCSIEKMVCKDEECVYASSQEFKARLPASICEIDLDCPFLYTCTPKGSCRLMSLKELQSLMGDIM